MKHKKEKPDSFAPDVMPKNIDEIPTRDMKKRKPFKLFVGTKGNMKKESKKIKSTIKPKLKFLSIKISPIIGFGILRKEKELTLFNEEITVQKIIVLCFVITRSNHKSVMEDFSDWE